MRTCTVRVDARRDHYLRYHASKSERFKGNKGEKKLIATAGRCRALQQLVLSRPLPAGPSPHTKKSCEREEISVNMASLRRSGRRSTASSKFNNADDPIVIADTPSPSKSNSAAHSVRTSGTNTPATSVETADGDEKKVRFCLFLFQAPIC